jgi:hypothetical protein
MSQEEKLKIVFHPVVPGFQESIPFLGGSQALLVCICSDNNM